MGRRGRSSARPDAADRRASRPKRWSASMPISTASPTCKAISSRSTPTTSTPRAASTCSGQASSDSTMRRRARSASWPTGISRHRGFGSEDVEKYPSKSTPFRLLLGDGVDLGRDARIVGVESEEGTLAITLEDKSGEAAGRSSSISTRARPQLKQWVITDAQGLATNVTARRPGAGTKGRGRLLHRDGHVSALPLEPKRCSKRSSAPQRLCVCRPRPKKIN